jgi:hypothetical protein
MNSESATGLRAPRPLWSRSRPERSCRLEQEGEGGIQQEYTCCAGAVPASRSLHMLRTSMVACWVTLRAVCVSLRRSILRKKYRLAVGTHYGPSWRHQAGFSLRHRRDCRAGTTILQLVSAFYDQTKALISDYGPAGAAGAWATPPHPPGPQDRSAGQQAG